MQIEVKMLKEFCGNVKDCKRGSPDSQDELGKRAFRSVITILNLTRNVRPPLKSSCSARWSERNHPYRIVKFWDDARWDSLRARVITCLPTEKAEPKLTPPSSIAKAYTQLLNFTTIPVTSLSTSNFCSFQLARPSFDGL